MDPSIDAPNNRLASMLGTMLGCAGALVAGGIVWARQTSGDFSPLTIGERALGGAITGTTFGQLLALIFGGSLRRDFWAYWIGGVMWLGVTAAVMVIVRLRLRFEYQWAIEPAPFVVLVLGWVAGWLMGRVLPEMGQSAAVAVGRGSRRQLMAHHWRHPGPLGRQGEVEGRQLLLQRRDGDPGRAGWAAILRRARALERSRHA